MALNSSTDYFWFFLSVYITVMSVASDQRDNIKLYAQGPFLISPRKKVFQKSLRSVFVDNWRGLNKRAMYHVLFVIKTIQPIQAHLFSQKRLKAHPFDIKTSF